jgi:glycosylphosphatidylinositol transamidase (GPIT) subunit GPI8
MPNRLDLSEDSKVSLPAKNLITIIGGILVGSWFAFGVIERLNVIETELQLMQQDLLEASTQKPIDQEQFMLLEFLSKEQDKLKEKIETEVPNIKKNDMTIQFHEERIIDLEEKNGTY